MMPKPQFAKCYFCPQIAFGMPFTERGEIAFREKMLFQEKNAIYPPAERALNKI